MARRVLKDCSDLVSPINLVREISLQNYVEESVSELVGLNSEASISESRRRLESFVADLKPYANPGDRWWEWRVGTEPLGQSGGVAVVRDDKIVWATRTWVS